MKQIPFFARFLIILFFAISFNVSAQNEKEPSLNHIAVYVYDLNNSSSFYKDIIGLKEIPEPFHDGKHTWFKIAEHSQLHLIQGATGITGHDKNSHICFSVANMDPFIDLLKRKHISFEDWAGKSNKVTTRPDGVKQIYLKDPDGFWIEINNDTF